MGDERIIKDLMYCSGFLRSRTEGKGSQRRVLFFLRERGPMTQQELLEEMGIRAGSLSELLSKLEAKGFLKKERSEADKRNYNVSITPEGLLALDDMHARHQADMTDLLSGLTPEERSQLGDLLAKLHALWRERNEWRPHCHKSACHSRPDDHPASAE